MAEVHLERGLHELNFGYDTKIEGHTKLILDVLKLSKIRSIRLNEMEKYEYCFNELISRINIYANDTVQYRGEKRWLKIKNM